MYNEIEKLKGLSIVKAIDTLKDIYNLFNGVTMILVCDRTYTDICFLHYNDSNIITEIEWRI